MGHQTIPRLNQPRRYYLFFPHKPFSNSNMSNCPPNQQRTSHLAETICCMIPGNVSTGVAELAPSLLPRLGQQTLYIQHKHPCNKAKLPCTPQTTSPDRRRELCRALFTEETRKVELQDSSSLLTIKLWPLSAFSSPQPLRRHVQSKTMNPLHAHCKLRHLRLRLQLQCNQDYFCLPPSICNQLRREVKPRTLGFFP